LVASTGTNVDLQLPPVASYPGRALIIKDESTGTGVSSLLRDGTDTIDEAEANYTCKKFEMLLLLSDGVDNWEVGSIGRRSNLCWTVVDFLDIPGSGSVPVPSGEDAPKKPVDVVNGKVSGLRMKNGQTTGVRCLSTMPNDFSDGSKDLNVKIYFAINGVPTGGGTDTVKFIGRFFIYDCDTDLTTEAHAAEATTTLLDTAFPTDAGIYCTTMSVPGSVAGSPPTPVITQDQAVMFDFYRSKTDSYSGDVDLLMQRFCLDPSTGAIGGGGGPT